MVSGAEFAVAQRSLLISELESARRLGLSAVMQLLKGVDPVQIDRWWFYIGPLIEQLILAQQRAGRQYTMAYIGGLGAAMGAGAVVARAPASSTRRDGLLPSGMEVSRLVRATPLAMAHRISNGMSPAEAWQITSGNLISAVTDAVHDEARKTAVDVLRQETVDWEALDAQFEKNIWDIRQNKLWEEQRRIRRNMSPRGQAALKSVWSQAWAVRYVRVPNPGACAFCLMLASKGPKYYGDSFKASNKQFRGNGDAKAHAHCRCVLLVEPSPGAFRNVIVTNGDLTPQDLAKVWTDTKYKQKYAISDLLAKKAIVKPPSV